MKAAQISKYGTSEVVEINKKAAKPELKEGHVIVEVYAAGLNPADWKIREGYFHAMMPIKFPATLGGDFSGIVIEIGKGVTNFKKDNLVYGQAGVFSGGSGSFAEFASADVKNISHKPKNITHVEAAALPLAGVSALQVLTEHMSISKGNKILIHGGAGGIGSIAIQIAKHFGAYVATTINGNDKDYVENFGADEIIDYKNQSFENILHDYDAVFDTVGGETYKKSFKILKKGGAIVSMLEQANQELMKKYDVKAISQYTQVNSSRLDKLTKLVEEKIIKVHVDKIFSLDETGGAMDYLQKKHPKGKVVLRVK